MQVPAEYKGVHSSETELWAFVSHPKWVLGPELRSFAAAVCALHCRPSLFSPNDCYGKKQKRNKKVPRFEEDTEMLEPSCIADENVKWASHNGEQYDNSFKN